MTRPELSVRYKPIEIANQNGRLQLVEFTLSDATELFNLIDGNREHLSQNGDTTAQNYPTLEAVRSSILNPTNPNKLRFAIRLKANATLIGTINLTPKDTTIGNAEIGYYLGSEFTGKCYMVEAVQLLTEYALRELGFKELFGIVDSQNAASMNVLQKAGYVLTEYNEESATLSIQVAQ